ncbi:MAG: helix-turn-helix transcriptional regulator [Solirubrobacteraceae bacterium]|nr:MAG: hypothetical protein DLM63_02415 [Solirubrobacterales bacterium]
MDLQNGPEGPLSQPVRARLFARLAELRRPVGTDELATELGLHPNGVRVHLDVLREAGLLDRERVRQRRGRPRDMWSVAPDAHPDGDPPRAYTDLARWLAGAMARGASSPSAIELAGRQIGAEIAPTTLTGSPETTMYAALASLGFQPQRVLDPLETLTYKLRNCPYRSVALDEQEVVCTLHKGLTEGLLDVIAPTSELAGFVPKDPDAAGCLITLRGPLADAARAEA